MSCMCWSGVAVVHSSRYRLRKCQWPGAVACSSVSALPALHSNRRHCGNTEHPPSCIPPLRQGILLSLPANHCSLSFLLPANHCSLRFPLPVQTIAVIPLDEIALAIAGLNGPDYVNNENLAYYLSLLRLVALVGSHRSCSH